MGEITKFNEFWKHFYNTFGIKKDFELYYKI